MKWPRRCINTPGPGRNHLWREFNQAVAQIRQIRKMREDLGGDKR